MTKSRFEPVKAAAVRQSTKEQSALACPACGARHNGVLDSRTRQDNTVRRRHICIECDHRWTTYERWEPTGMQRARAAIMQREFNTTRCPVCNSKVAAGELIRPKRPRR